jgi:segregation and condensation protein B
VEYNLVYEVGRLDAPGRPALFATTEEFLRRFGVGNLEELPDINPAQEAEIKAEVEAELQLKMEELPSGEENILK